MSDKCPSCGASLADRHIGDAVCVCGHVTTDGGQPAENPMDRTNYCADCEQHAREVAGLKAELADWQSSADRAAGEMCGDEKHCTCVPLLRKQLAEARKDSERLDFLDETHQSLYWPEDELIRAVLDAARKEE